MNTKRFLLLLLLAYLIVVTLKADGIIAINKGLYLGMCALALLLTIIPIVRDYLTKDPQ